MNHDPEPTKRIFPNPHLFYLPDLIAYRLETVLEKLYQPRYNSIHGQDAAILFPILYLIIL